MKKHDTTHIHHTIHSTQNIPNHVKHNVNYLTNINTHQNWKIHNSATQSLQVTEQLKLHHTKQNNKTFKCPMVRRFREGFFSVLDYVWNKYHFSEHIYGYMELCCIDRYRIIKPACSYIYIHYKSSLNRPTVGQTLNGSFMEVVFVCLVLFYVIATVFQLYHGSDMIYEMRRRKPEWTLLPTQEIFMLPPHICLAWGELTFDTAVSYTQQVNGLPDSYML